MAIEKLSVILELVSGNYKREAREAATATGQIGDSAKGTTSALQRMAGPIAIGAVVAGVGRMASAAIASASALEQSMGGVESVFGSVSGKINEFGETSAESVGLATSSFNNLALLTGALLKNMGVPLDETADKTLVLTERAADLAATFGGPVSNAVEAINSALKGEANPIEAYGIKLNAAAVEARVLADNTGLLKNQITDAHKAQAIYNIILDQSADSAGQFGREIDTAAGQQERFKAELENARAEIGARLLPVMVRLLQSGRNLIPVFKDVAEEITNTVEELAPLVELVVELGGWILRLRGDVDDMSESQSGWNQFLGDGVDVLEGMLNPLVAYENLVTAINDVFGEMQPKLVGNKQATDEVHDSWNLAAIAAGLLKESIGPTVGMLDRQTTAHRNVAVAATNQRTALINLFNAQADLLDPVRSVLLLTKESIEADKRLVEVQADRKATTQDVALALIEAEQAQLRLNSASASLSADQIQAFSQLLVRELGYSEKAALDLLVALGLVDGFEVDVSVKFSVMNKSLLDSIAAAGGGEINNWDEQVRASGGPVRRGMPYIVGEQGPELMIPDQNGMILPNGAALGGNVTYITKQGSNIIVQSPMGNFRQDLQYATILASVTNLVEGF